MGRFLNADSYADSDEDIFGTNMFAYCANNPVNRVDLTGAFWKEIGNFFSGAWNGIKTWAKNTFGAGSSTTATLEETEKPILPDPLPITAKIGTKTTKTVSKHGDASKPISVYANKDLQHLIRSSSTGIRVNAGKFTLDLGLSLDNIGISGSLTNGNTTSGLGIRLNLSELKVGFESSTAVEWDDTIDTTSLNVSINGWAIVMALEFLTTGEYHPSPVYP